MSSVFSNLKPRGDVGRNGFDLSRRSVFSTKCGLITPVFCQATLPNSEYEIDVKQLLRTQPLQTAAFTGFTINYDFFFVPNNFGYSSFNEFISQRDDSRHVGQPSRFNVPRIDLGNFLMSFIPLCVWDYIMQWKFPSCIAYDSSRFIDPTVHAHFALVSPNMPWASVCLETLRSLDMFGYGNYLPLVKRYADTLWHELEGLDRPLVTYYDFLNRLSDYEGIIDFSSLGNLVGIMFGAIDQAAKSIGLDLWITETPQVQPTLWPFLSYNKAFYEYYRNVYYDSRFEVGFYQSSHYINDNGFDYVKLFNFDDWTTAYLQIDSDISDDNNMFSRIIAIMCPKCHLYKKDLFTGVLPSTQFGDVSVMISSQDWHNLVASYSKSAAIGENDLRINHISSTNTSNNVFIGASSSPSASPTSAKFRFDPGIAISVLESRRADAMQRFKERMLRAGNKVKDVFKAHGWEEPYSANEVSPFFIGTFDGRLDINTVAATTIADNQELGQLGANGVSVVQGNKLRFRSHDFGMIVGVMYIIKDAEYDAYGVERQHCLTDPFDYPYPELQNISLHPIDILEVSNYLRWNQSNNIVNSRIIGYLPRFMEYKTSLDKVHGEFYSAGIEPSDGGVDFRGYRDAGVFSDWVTPRLDINNPTSLGFLYQSPLIADNIFLQQSNALQSTDQFLVNCYFDVKAVEPISVIGLPI